MMVKKLLKNFEIYLGSILISVTVVVVITNVFLRYFFSEHQIPWTEEVAVGCFVWTVFLGATGSYRKSALIGIDFVVAFLPPRIRSFVKVLSTLFLLLLNIVLFFLSLGYVYNSSKVSAILEFSYRFISSSILVSFFLMSIYSCIFFLEALKSFRKQGRLR